MADAAQFIVGPDDAEKMLQNLKNKATYMDVFEDKDYESSNAEFYDQEEDVIKNSDILTQLSLPPKKITEICKITENQSKPSKTHKQKTEKNVFFGGRAARAHILANEWSKRRLKSKSIQSVQSCIIQIRFN